MGFPKDRVNLLFSNKEQDINDAFHAVDLLIKTERGWIHKPIVARGGVCKICGDSIDQHVG